MPKSGQDWTAVDKLSATAADKANVCSGHTDKTACDLLPKIVPARWLASKRS